MANYKAVANGNWSALATWEDDSTGSFVASTVLPGASDVVYFNNFTVQMDVDVTVLEIRNDSSTGVTAGGQGVISASRTVNADITAGNTANATITISAGAGSVVNINGNLDQVVLNGNNKTISITGTCTVNVVGNLTTNQSTNNGPTCNVIDITVGATVNVTGNIFSGAQTSFAPSQRTISCGANSTLNVVGNIYAGTSGRGMSCIAVVGGGVNVNVTGNVYGGTTSDLNNTNSAISIVGAISNVAVNTTGIVEAGSNTPALFGSYNTAGQFRHTGIVKDGGSGFTAVLAPYFFIENSPSQYEFKRSNLTTNILYTFDLSDNPAQTDVRSGIAYGPANIFVGTCAVPPAAAVSIGVPVDNTVGTGYLNATDIWNVPLASITTPNSIGERLKDASTVQSTGAQLAAFL